MNEKEKYFIDLSKLSEEQQKHIFSLLPEPEFDNQYEVSKYDFKLSIDQGGQWWVYNEDRIYSKQELTYPEFIKLFEGGEVPNELLKSVSPKLWGEIYPEFTPRLCKNVLGDGLQLIWFQTSDQRPYWWWVLIDSNWDMSDEDYSLQVYDLIEDEFGSIPDEDDEDYNEELHSDVMNCYPMIVHNDGILWGTQIENISKINSNQ